MIEFLVCKECANFIKSRFPEDVEWIEDGEQTDPGAAEYYVNLQILNAKDEKCELCRKHRVETVIDFITEYEEIKGHFITLLKQMKGE